MATLDELSEAYNESSVNIANSPTSISFLKPSTMSGLGAMPSGDIDVINNYDWTVTPANLRKDIPKLSMVEFEMDGNIRMSNIIYWARNLLGSVERGPKMRTKGFTEQSRQEHSSFFLGLGTITILRVNLGRNSLDWADWDLFKSCPKQGPLCRVLLAFQLTIQKNGREVPLLDIHIR